MTPADAARHLSAAYEARFGKPPSARTLGVLWAQWALETGRGASMVGHNFGNVKGRGPSGRSFETTTVEGFGANAHGVRDRFRVYDTPAEGARDYLSLLDRRYPEALKSAQNGDAARFGRELERGGYFTADPTKYRPALVSLAAEFEAHGAGDGPPGAGPTPPVDPGPFVESLLWTLSRAVSQRGA